MYMSLDKIFLAELNFHKLSSLKQPMVSTVIVLQAMYRDMYHIEKGVYRSSPNYQTIIFIVKS